MTVYCDTCDYVPAGVVRVEGVIQVIEVCVECPAWRPRPLYTEHRRAPRRLM